jgi:hypothetical protein
MKTITIAFQLLIICINSAFGQGRDTIYYDKNWKVTDNKKYEFYRVAFRYKGIIQVTDHYKSGKIQMTGTYKSSSFSEPTGQFFYYKKNGHFDHQTIYEPLKYHDLLSPYYDYLKLISPLPDTFHIEIDFRKGGSIWGIAYISDTCSCKSRWLYLSKEGDLWFQMSFLNHKSDGRYISYFGNKKAVTGQFKNGKKNGEWVFYKQDGTIRKKEDYNGKKVR